MTGGRGSPWWYRRRSLVIFLIYLAGFYGGAALWQGLTHGPYFPVYALLAAHMSVSPHALLWAGAALVTLGFGVRLWGSAYLSASVVWNANALDDRLIVDGPFRYIRNPLYFGNNLQALGFALIATPYGAPVIVLGSVLFTILLAAHEAQLMRARYGVVYERFRATVPAMFPRLTPARVEGSVRGRASFTGGMRSELLTLGLTIGMIGLAIVGFNGAPFFGACWVGGWILQTILRAQTSAASTA